MNDEESPPPRPSNRVTTYKRGSAEGDPAILFLKKWWMLGAALGFLLMAVIFVSIDSGGGSGSASKAMDKRDFERLVYDKSEQEGVRAVGRPSSTQSIGGDQIWYYNKIAVDPITGTRVDAQIVFPGGLMFQPVNLVLIPRQS